MFFLASHGYGVIAHDRCGHGRSSQRWQGNEMDTYADDPAELVARPRKHSTSWRSCSRRAPAQSEPPSPVTHSPWLAGALAAIRFHPEVKAGM
jgi:alpha-beta hydrolase superfamily lysophospholipase